METKSKTQNGMNWKIRKIPILSRGNINNYEINLVGYVKAIA